MRWFFIIILFFTLGFNSYAQVGISLYTESIGIRLWEGKRVGMEIHHSFTEKIFGPGTKGFYRILNEEKLKFYSGVGFLYLHPFGLVEIPLRIEIAFFEKIPNLIFIFENNVGISIDNYRFYYKSHIGFTVIFNKKTKVNEKPDG